MNWPITPLGVWQSYLLLRDAYGEMKAVAAEKLHRNTISTLFAHDTRTLINLFPSSWARGWNHHQAAEAIIAACGTCGVVSPERFGFVPIYRHPRRRCPTVVLVPQARPIERHQSQGNS